MTREGLTMALLSLKTGKVWKVTVVLVMAGVLCLMGLVVVGVIGNSFWYAHHMKRVEALREEARAAGYPLTPEDLNLMFASPEGQENAAPLYVRASELMDHDEARVDRLYQYEHYSNPDELQLGEWPSDAMVADLREHVAANARSFELIEKATSLTSFCPVSDWGVHVDDMTEAEEHWLHTLSAVRRSGQLLEWRSKLYAVKGRVVEAAEDLSRDLRASNHVLQFPTDSGVLYGQVQTVTALDELDRLRALVPLGRDSLDELMGLLNNDLPEQAYRNSLLSTRVHVESMFTGTESFFWPATQFPARHFGYWKDWHAGALEHVKAWQEASERLDVPEGYEPLGDEPSQKEFATRPFRKTTLDITLRNIALRRVNLVALACDAYRLEHGVFPETLKALVPEYLEAVPEDPFAPGEQVKLARKRFGLAVYSVGLDLWDHGGRRYLDDGSDYRAGTDIAAWCFTRPGVVVRVEGQ